MTPPLLARTRRVESSSIDLLASAADGYVVERDHYGLAGCGIATRLLLPHGLSDEAGRAAVAECLSAITVDDEVGLPGCGPVAFGALPFSPGAPSSLIVPKLVAGRGPDGAAWVTTIGPPGCAAQRWPDPCPVPSCEPDEFSLEPSMSHRDWRRLVASAVADIDDGTFEKVVLAREVVVSANRDIDIPTVLTRLRALYPSCAVFSIEGFVGASPELLVRRTGADVASHPMAGTIPRSGDANADDALAAALLASAKERSEHRYVVDDVARDLGAVCSLLNVPEAPSIVALRNVSHLGTRITGSLRGKPSTWPTALDLVARLHPTSAVGGSPREAALSWLTAHEGFARDRYAGPVGWVDSRGDGEWVVGIRSARIHGGTAHLYAGVGVVADSDPEAELAETQLKLQALLAAVVRP